MRSGREERFTGLIVGIPCALAALVLIGEFIDWRQAIYVAAILNMAGMTLMIIGFALKGSPLENILANLVISWTPPVAAIMYISRSPSLLVALLIMALFLRGPVVQGPAALKRRIDEWTGKVAWLNGTGGGARLVYACAGIGVMCLASSGAAMYFGGPRIMVVAGFCAAAVALTGMILGMYRNRHSKASSPPTS